MPDVPDAERHTDNKKYIETAFGVLCNTSLLSNHTASWEMLVSKRPIIEYNTEGNLTAHIPVIQTFPCKRKKRKEVCIAFAYQNFINVFHLIL